MDNIERIEIDISDYPALSQFRRTIDKRVDSVDVFIENNKVSIYATDIKSGIQFIMQEPTSVQHIIEGKIKKVDEEDMMWDLGDELSILDDEEIENIENNKKSQVNDENNSEKREDIGDKVISFSISSSFLDVMSTFKKCILGFDNKNELIIWSSDYRNTASYQITSAYQNLSEEVDILKKSTWMELKIGPLKDVIRVLDGIEPKRYRQVITLDNDKVYTYGDTLACEYKIQDIKDKYVFDYELIRILKYTCTSETIAYITRINEDQIALDVNGLKIIYPKSQLETANILEGIDKIKFNPFVLIDKTMSDSLNLTAKFLDATKLIRIVSQIDGVIIGNTRITTYNPTKGKTLGTLNIDSDLLKLGLSIAGDNTTIYIEDTQLRKENPIIKLVNKVTIIIEGNSYEPTYIE